jgi:HD-GYP domain-containing protein (c-di-GMP phosphodiesterase class II)
VALTGESVVIDDVYADTRFDLSGTKQFSEASGLRAVSMLTVPLYPREGEVIGLLQLINAVHPDTGAVVPFDAETVGFIEALATQSAVTIENQNLLLSQKALMDSMIKIIAGAIDAKSPYTGGHCERVPELAVMLAEAAGQVTEGPLSEFGFKTEDEWTEFRIGAWLHDCGKVTTPEYVVDKATKLETIYNRIHEIRTRFEVLLRDAEIATHKAIAAGQDPASAWAAYEQRKTQLQDDYAFVADTNLGGEFMAPERIERIRSIAGQTWWRHFSDRIGLSHEEERRIRSSPEPALPVQEPLLADKPHHIVPRGPDKAIDPQHGFRVKVPEHLYNAGEVYNLCIARGTLTEEERFKINEHIIQTIVMLDNMPFPKHLRRVPEYAGTHHETLTGSGYPRKLTAAELSVPSRIMAIADIFEALTASDRPYKKAKTLSESIKILSFFKKDGHIDPVLFDLFLSSGVYRRYAERFLLPEQIDEVDIAAYLG